MRILFILTPAGGKRKARAASGVTINTRVHLRMTLQAPSPARRLENKSIQFLREPKVFSFTAGIPD